MKKTTILLFFLLHSIFTSAQTLDYNSLILNEEDIETSSFKLMPALPEYKFDLDLDFSENFKFEKNFKLENFKFENFKQPKSFQLIDFNNNIFNHTPQNNRSWLTLSHNNATYWGLGCANTVSGAYNFKLNDYVTLSAGMYAGKYSINDNFMNDAGIHGNIKLALSDRFDLHVFGRYSFNNMQTVYGSSMFPQTGLGGALEYKVNDVFGIRIGTYYEYDAIRGTWVLRPYIVPVFYKSLLEILGWKKKKKPRIYY